MAMDKRPAWQAMSRRPRIMLDTDTIEDNPTSVYNAAGVEVNEVGRADVKDAIGMVFDQAEKQKLDGAALDEYLMDELPKVCDATPEDIKEIIFDARFFDTTPATEYLMDELSKMEDHTIEDVENVIGGERFAEMDQPPRSVADQLKDAVLSQFARSEYTVELTDENGETIGVAATLKNVDEENLPKAVEDTLNAFGYEVADDERGTLRRIDPWNPTTVEKAIMDYPVAVDESTLEADRQCQMNDIRKEAFKTPDISAVMMADGRLDAYGEYGLGESKVGAITTFDHAANVPRDIGGGMVIGFDRPTLTVRTTEAIGDEADSGQRIQETLEANGAHGSFTDTRVEVDGADTDPWTGQEEASETMDGANPWQNIDATAAMAAGPEID
ncbi:hypothetical protein C8077_05045 [Bifidobacterium adolescentis]|uniref:Uncharacterized protein n=1 Tax=Bifidobacterium adolescentis TaxID=1680 RepID=A0A2R4G390_BIFAD|nr:hypothetical protein [Bifidobacterium adolescentis]AVT45340.1 hypothetical protein C8077_05045 [Bifidobacterium adolescentis]